MSTARRRREGMLKHHLAVAVDCDPSTIAYAEMGRIPRRQTVVRMAEVLGLDPGYLLLLAGYAPQDLSPAQARKILNTIRRVRGA